MQEVSLQQKIKLLMLLKDKENQNVIKQEYSSSLDGELLRKWEGIAQILNAIEGARFTPLLWSKVSTNFFTTV